MSAQISSPTLDCTKIRAAWIAMRGEYHALVNSISPSALKRPTVDTRWSIGEILTHMIQSIEYIPQEIEAARKGKDFMNLPTAIAAPGNLIIVKMLARKVTPQALLTRYDKAFEAAMRAWDGVTEDEWNKGANFFGEGYRTMAENYALGITHFNEHAAQIRKSLAVKKGY